MNGKFRAVVFSVMLAAGPQVLGAQALDEAQALINQGNYQQALSRLDSHLKQNPQDAEARFTRGLVLVKLARNDEALKTFADLTRDYPQLPEPYNNLAVLYAQRGDYEKARDALEAALATHPSYATAHENLGDIYAALASSAYNRALMLDQENGTLRQKLRLMEQMNTMPAGASESIASAPAAGSSAPPPVATTVPPPVIRPAPAQNSTPPVSGPSVQTPTPETAESISRALYDWSTAWSNQNVANYIAAYDLSFLPDDGLSRAAWEAQRRERLRNPSRIQVRVINPQIDLIGDGLARVTFTQTYTSDTYSDEVTKILEMRERGGRWLITRETTR